MSSISGSGSSDTSGYGSGYGSGSPEASSELASNTTGTVGGQSTLSDSLSADSGSSTMSTPSVSGASPKRHKPMDRDEKIAYLEDMIKTKGLGLMSLSEEIALTIRRQTQLLEKDELSTKENTLLSVIGINLPDMRGREVRLAAEIAKHEAELSELKNPKELVDAPVPAQGMYIYKSSIST